MSDSSRNAPARVELIVRPDCGSCVRIEAQIRPVVAAAGASMVVRSIAGDPELAAEFGDRVPVVLLDGEEFACWEVDNQDLGRAMLG
nr:glutaredoxin family protein [Corynebacterium caspium]